ncbi:hypothetical protein L208DRAFT_1235800 [Tricholoma matsutake]|nr:hypothetical protein L208DRAFT_1235800 [Tricholoma matsutake 945]
MQNQQISKIFTIEELQPFINIGNAQKFKFISYLTQLEATELQISNAAFVSGNIPLNLLAPKLAIADLKVIAKCHQITVHSKIKIQDLQNIISNHVCHKCEEYITAFELISNSELDAKKQAAQLKAVQKYQGNISHLNAVKKSQEKQSKLFPPIPPSKKLEHTIISDFCQDTAPSQFMESGCAVCGKLTPRLQLQALSETDLDLNILIQPGMSQRERTCSDDPITVIEGPILDNDLDHICKPCFKSISQGKVPLMALANGKWIGKVPSQLNELALPSGDILGYFPRFL